MTFSTSVVRPSIVRLAEHPWFRHLATETRPGRAVASRFVAGETLEQAMLVARDLDRRRTTSMLDHLGENVETVAQAAEARDAYLAALAAIRQEPDAGHRDLAQAHAARPRSFGRRVPGERRADPGRGRRAGDVGDDRHGGASRTWGRRSRSRGRCTRDIPASASRCSPTCAGRRRTSSISRPACACGW